jgi:linoleoyl-CoA desaturase
VSDNQRFPAVRVGRPSSPVGEPTRSPRASTADIAPDDRVADTVWREAMPTPAEVDSARRRLHRKAGTIVALFLASYFVLVVSDVGLVLRAVAAGGLVISLVAVATGIMHDANHGSFARRRGVNRALSFTSDALGASSWLWRIQHNQLHHANTNVVGHDADIELAPLARLAPSQPWHPRYRFQHLYLWPLYGLMPLKNLLVSDVMTLTTRRLGQQALGRRVTVGVVAEITAGKLLHLVWAVVVPLMFNPWQWVLVVYLACSWMVGFVLAVVFQLAHTVGTAEVADADVPRRGAHRVAHQLRTTVDVATPTPVLGAAFRWLVGGLDHQVEHHLSPGLPHTVYPRVAARFRAACEQHGIAHHRHPGIGAAVRSHARWLKAMGSRPVPTC